MSNLKKMGTLGAVGVLMAGGLILGSSPANAVTCTGTSLPTNSMTGTTVAATGFESGSFTPFVPSTATTGTATVSTSQHFSGSCSAKLHVTSDAGSMALLSLSLGSTSAKRANADGRFNITTAGVTGNDVPYLRFFSNGTRIADIYRYNSNGQLWLRVTAPNGTFSYTKLVSSTIPLNTWHRAQMEVTANGSASTIKVWFDGALEYSSSAVNLGVTSLTHVQLGAEHSRQMGDEYIDSVIVKRASS